MIKKEITVINLTNEEKIILFRSLGYEVDTEGYIIKEETKERITDRYTTLPIKLENASILPGSTIILDTNPFSLSEYFEEFREDDF